MAVVVFDAAAFKVAYPEFAAVSDTVLQSCFDTAGLYLSNEDCSPVPDLAKRQQFLWLLTAHIAALRGFGPGAGRAGMVGRISSATEGSVSVSTEYGVPGTSAWFIQTPYGAEFWQATLYLRSFRYRPRATQY